MSSPLHTDFLRRVTVFAQLPETKLQWIITQGKELRLQPGELLRAEGTPTTHMFILLAGSIRLTQRIGNQDVLLKPHDAPSLFGEVPLLMGVPNYWASGYTITACHILELSAETFWQLMGCPTLATTILQTMIERMQEAINCARNSLPLDPLTQSDREDNIIEWMDAHNIQSGWQLASTLVNAGLDSNWLDRIASHLEGQCLNEILLWVDATLTVVGLLGTLEHGTGRIHQLVEAVQDYSSLDSTWIRTRCDGDLVLVEIADNGIGIPQEVQPHIFEPFFTTKSVGKGTGLGLNISYKIVEQHGGDIRVTSHQGDTCFQIRLPRNH